MNLYLYTPYILKLLENIMILCKKEKEQKKEFFSRVKFIYLF